MKGNYDSGELLFLFTYLKCISSVLFPFKAEKETHRKMQQNEFYSLLLCLRREEAGTCCCPRVSHAIQLFFFIGEMGAPGILEVKYGTCSECQKSPRKHNPPQRPPHRRSPAAAPQQPRK